MHNLNHSLSFHPRGPLRNPHLQTFLASYRPFRRWLTRLPIALERSSREVLLDCGEGVRLQGFHTPARERQPPRGLVVLFHGWEGSARSTYLVALARHLWRQGYELFRLNFRDHGATHHLNPGIFHSCRLAEVLGAMRSIVGSFPTRPLYLIGFSLGGNFALRVARNAQRHAIPLAHTMAVNPAIDPAHVLETMERGSGFYARYFMKKWGRSLELKQRAFPDRYDGAWSRCEGLRETTRYLVETYSDFKDLDSYFSGYSIGGEYLAPVTTPASIITAADDPIVPVSDFAGLRLPPCVQLEIQTFGGHCGYIGDRGLGSWIHSRIDSTLRNSPG